LLQLRYILLVQKRMQGSVLVAFVMAGERSKLAEPREPRAEEVPEDTVRYSQYNIILQRGRNQASYKVQAPAYDSLDLICAIMDSKCPSTANTVSCNELLNSQRSHLLPTVRVLKEIKWTYSSYGMCA
jgi:hypothetical protein